MRVATLQSFYRNVENMMRNQIALNKTQQQISTGKKVLSPSDDPFAATRILELEHAQSNINQYKKNMNAAKSRLALEEKSLTSITEQLSRLKQLTIQAGDGALTQSNRQAIAAEVKQIKKLMVDVLNSVDSGGDYIFSGFKGSTKPFQLNADGRYEFHGDEGQRHLNLNATVAVATGDSGKTLFVDIPASKNTFNTASSPKNKGDATITPGFVVNQETYDKFYPDDLIITFNAQTAVSPPQTNYTVTRASDGRVVEGLSAIKFSSGKKVNAAGVDVTIFNNPKPGDQFAVRSSPKQSMLDTVVRLEDGLNRLSDNPTDSKTLKNLIADTLKNIKAAETVVTGSQTVIGARLNAISKTQSLTDDIEVVNKKALSAVAHTDIAEAATRLSMQAFLLEATQQSYSKISRLSLFDRI